MQLAASLQGVVTQQLVPTRRAGAGPSPPRCWSPRRPSATSSVRARPTRSTRRCRPAGSTACRRWTSRSPTWSRRDVITLETAIERCANDEDLRRLQRRRRATEDDRWPRPTPTRSATSRGKLLEGSLEADTTTLVANKLRQMGYVPVAIDKKAAARAPEGAQDPRARRRKVKLKDVAVFSRQFATMINSGLSLLRSLHILAEQTENKELADVIDEVRQDVEKGCVAVAGAGPAPEGLQPPLRRHGACGRDRRRARLGAAAAGRHHREAGRAASARSSRP